MSETWFWVWFAPTFWADAALLSALVLGLGYWSARDRGDWADPLRAARARREIARAVLWVALLLWLFTGGQGGLVELLPWRDVSLADDMPRLECALGHADC